MEASKKSLERLKNGYQVHLAGNDEVDSAKINELEEKFHQAINDDLNMPLAMGIVWDVIKQENKSFKWAELLAKFDTVLALKIEQPIEETKQEIPEEILDLVEQRKQARANKDWAKSDELRDFIQNKGYQIKDTKEGVEIKKV